MTISISLLAVIFLLLLGGFVAFFVVHSLHTLYTRCELPYWVTEMREIALEALHRINGPHHLLLDHFEIGGEHEGKKSWYWKRANIYLFPPRDVFVFIRLSKMSGEYIKEITNVSKKEIGGTSSGSSPTQLFVEVPVPVFEMTEKEASLLGFMSRKALRNGWKIEKIEVERGGGKINFLRYKFFTERELDVSAPPFDRPEDQKKLAKK